MHYLFACLIAMVPVVELRGAIPFAIGWGIDPWLALCMCTLCNMLPVPVIYFFARKFLVWGKNRAYIGKICSFFLVKGERAGQKLVAKTGRKGLFFALLLFVGVPIPGTGAWTGTLGASFLDLGFKSTVVAVSLGILMAGGLMAMFSMGLVHIF